MNASPGPRRQPRPADPRQEGPNRRLAAQHAADRAAPEGRPTNPHALARRVLSDLRHLCRLLARTRSADAELDAIAQMQTQITIELGGDGIHPRIRRRSRDLVRQLESRLQELFAARPAARDGRVYCYRCESSECEHAAPAEFQDVFRGYHPTGRPVYGSFTTLCLEHRPERAADLFDDRSAVVAIVLGADDLHRDQLAAFGRGSRVYEILGQVCIGLLPGRARRGTTPERHALSLQVVRVLDHAEARHPRLNVVAGSTAPDDPLSGLADRDVEILRDILETARQRLRDVAGGTSGSRTLEAVVPSYLTWLGRSVEHAFRQRNRRTRHAAERADDARRPTQKANEDARRSTADRLLVDTEEDTYVVLGPRRRAHVYSLAGLHVTSLVISGEDVRRRTTAGRWRAVTPAEWQAFRSALDLDRH